MVLPEVVVYQDRDFGGWEWRTNLREVTSLGAWGDQISSIIVVSGTWQFFEDDNFCGAQSKPLKPGYYSWVEDPIVDIKNDSISSFKCINSNPI